MKMDQDENQKPQWISIANALGFEIKEKGKEYKKSDAEVMREIRETFKAMSQQLGFPKKQSKLLLVLADLLPHRESELKKRIGTDNLKSLVKVTRRTLKRHLSREHLSEILQIKPLRGDPFRGYRLRLKPPATPVNPKL